VKSTKIKEVVFHTSAPNYLDFLTTMLTKYEKLSVFKVTAKKRYSFKYIPGASFSNGQVVESKFFHFLQLHLIHENGAAFLISLKRTGRDVLPAVE
jgi:hypothetical protein